MTAFQANLSSFLQSVGVNTELLIHDVDFSQLSPAVHLICTIPGLYRQRPSDVVRCCNLDIRIYVDGRQIFCTPAVLLLG